MQTLIKLTLLIFYAFADISFWVAGFPFGFEPAVVFAI